MFAVIVVGEHEGSWAAKPQQCAESAKLHFLKIKVIYCLLSRLIKASLKLGNAWVFVWAFYQCFSRPNLSKICLHKADFENFS